LIRVVECLVDSEFTVNLGVPLIERSGERRSAGLTGEVASSLLMQGFLWDGSPDAGDLADFLAITNDDGLFAPLPHLNLRGDSGGRRARRHRRLYDVAHQLVEVRIVPDDERVLEVYPAGRDAGSALR
jgi:hypothetical protein